VEYDSLYLKIWAKLSQFPQTRQYSIGIRS